MKIIIFDLDDTLLDTTRTVPPLGKPLQGIQLVLGAEQCLEIDGVRKILVTAGDPKRQEEKIAILGIRPFFEEVHIVPKGNDKLPLFRSIAERFAIPPREIMVVGNRVDTEIRYGNMCEFTTVLFEYGKYKTLVPHGRLEEPVHRIWTLYELRKLVHS